MSCTLKWHWVYSCFVAFLRFVMFFFLLSNGSSIFCFYKATVKQILCQSIMENKDHGVKSYPLIRAAMQYVGGGSMSPPQCKERLQSGGKSQPPMKLQNLWLHPAFPRSTSWINSWPCLCRAATRCRAWLCLQPAKSLWGGGVVLSSSLEDTKLLREVTLGHVLGNTLSSHSAVWSHLIYHCAFIWKRKGLRVLYVTYFSGS